MVQMRVRDKNRRDGFRVVRERFEVLRLRVMASLIEAAVDHDPGIAGFENIVRPRHLPRRAVKSKFH